MIGVIDYGAGNLDNVLRALDYLGYAARILTEPEEMDGKVSLAILPGVGAFCPAMEELSRRGWTASLPLWANSGRPILGICLGMQLLYEWSLEDGRTAGLGFFRGEVIPLEGLKKSPHMGWNQVRWAGDCFWAREAFPQGLDAYFVHGYAACVTEDTLAETSVEKLLFSSISMRSNVAGFQFHPERSGLEGLRLLDLFVARLTGENS